MKKIILSIVTVLSTTLLTSCGGLGSALSALGSTDTSTTTSTTASSTSGLLGNLISTFASGITTNQSSLVGTWTYNKPCVQFESSNLLAKAGGSVMATQVESKLETYYQKVGIKQGACTFVFGNDGTLNYTIGSKTYTGSYTFDSTNKTVTIKTSTGQSVKAYVSISGSSMGLTFDTSKLLTLLNSASSVSSSLSSISSLASSFSGMKLGFEFSK